MPDDQNPLMSILYILVMNKWYQYPTIKSQIKY